VIVTSVDAVGILVERNDDCDSTTESVGLSQMSIGMVLVNL
jgi:hypothetical protein